MSMPNILQPQSLLALYERFTDDSTPLAEFFPARPNPGPGQAIKYDVVEYGRDIAQINTRSGAPQEIKPATRSTVSCSAISISEAIYIDPATMKDLRAPGSFAQRNGMSEVTRAVAQLRMRLLKRLAVFRAQALGTASGNISFTLPGGIAETVSLGYRASHQAIGSAWQTTSTDIIADIEAAKELVERDGGKAATTLVCNSSVMAYICANTKVLALLSDAAKDEMRLTGRLSRLCELDLKVVRQGYVPDSSGTFTNYIPDNHVAILAADNSERAMLECDPVSQHAPDGMKGAYFQTTLEPRLKGGAWVEFEWSGFPLLSNPDEVVYDTTVAA